MLSVSLSPKVIILGSFHNYIIWLFKKGGYALNFLKFKFLNTKEFDTAVLLTFKNIFARIKLYPMTIVNNEKQIKGQHSTLDVSKSDLWRVQVLSTVWQK